MNPYRLWLAARAFVSPRSRYPGAGETTVQQEIDLYLEALYLRTTSEDTRRCRTSQLKRFRTWAEGEGITKVSELTREAIVRYLRYRQDGGASSNTIASIGSTLRTWLAWLVDLGHLERVPRIRTPANRMEIPRVISPEQVAAIVAACEDRTPLGFRDRALVEFLYATGARCAEARALNLEELDLERRKAKIRGKGRRERMGILTVRAAEALRVYIERFRHPCEIPFHSRAVFVSRNGYRMARNVIHAAVRRRGELAGITGVHPHLFRHSIATHLLQRGAGLRHVQSILGHRHIASTQLYTHLVVDDIERAVEAHHPRP